MQDLRLLLKPAEAAQAIGVSRARIYELIADGEIPSLRIRGSVRVPLDRLKEWIEERTNQRASENSTACSTGCGAG